MEDMWRRTLEAVQVIEAVAAASLQIFGLKRSEDGGIPYTTLDEALGAGTVEVGEVSKAGRVPHLKVINKGDAMLFIMAGEQLIGAKQNRVVNASTMLGPKGEWTIDVSCVERGRWGYVSRNFRGDNSSSHAKLRRMMLRKSSAAYRREGRPGSDQGAVWREVDRKLMMMGSRSPSAALHQAFADHRSKLDGALRELAAPAGCCGAVFAIGGRIAGVEFFDKPSTLSKLWPKLVNAYAIDALEEGEEAAINRDDVVRWLESSCEGHLERFKSPGLGEDFRFESDEAVGACLVVEDCPVHLELFPKLKDEA